MAVNLDAASSATAACACRETQVNDVIGYALRGADSIVFDLDDPWAPASLRGLRRMRAGLPTGALSPKTQIGSQRCRPPGRFSLPFCGVAASSPTTCAMKDHQRRRPRRPGQPWPPVRQRLWFRLRPPPDRG